MTVGLRAAIFDFGGVMTQPVAQMFKAFATGMGLTTREGRAVVAAVYAGGPAGEGAIQQLERGDITPAQLGDHLAQAILAVTGRPVAAEGLFEQMWGQLRLEEDMVEGVRRLRADGVRTALLSNSWGVENYPFESLDGIFDLLVISGTERMRKPDEAIYHRTLERLVEAPRHTVFVDDLAANVDVALRLGMQGILHTSAAETLARLEVLFDRPAGSLGGR
ncbi:MAG TPA: HAD family phosphatase [Euzebya sp.]|nr:HAD family phosphatase [Euzebya sp.]